MRHRLPSLNHNRYLRCYCYSIYYYLSCYCCSFDDYLWYYSAVTPRWIQSHQTLLYSPVRPTSFYCWWWWWYRPRCYDRSVDLLLSHDVTIAELFGYQFLLRFFYLSTAERGRATIVFVLCCMCECKAFSFGCFSKDTRMEYFLVSGGRVCKWTFFAPIQKSPSRVFVIINPENGKIKKLVHRMMKTVRLKF